MKLLTKEIEKAIPKLYANEDKKPEDVPVVVKFFCPWNNWTWYATEGERQEDDFIFFGYVQGFEGELGYFSLKELESVSGPLGLKIERDISFSGKTLAQVMKRRQ